MTSSAVIKNLAFFLSVADVSSIRSHVVDVQDVQELASCKIGETSCKWIPKHTKSYCSEGDAARKKLADADSVEKCGEQASADSECMKEPYTIYSSVEAGGKECRCLKKACTIVKAYGSGNVFYSLERPSMLPDGAKCKEKCPRVAIGSGFCELCNQGSSCKGTGEPVCTKLSLNARVVDADEDPKEFMSLAPDSYPEELRGVLWMDQAGFYAHASIPDGLVAPDALVAFGDNRENPDKNNWQLNEETGVQYVDIGGPGWTWYNNEKGYHKVQELKGDNFFYEFNWKVDGKEPYKFAQIWPRNIHGFSSLYKGLLDFNMFLQVQKEWCGKCTGEDETEGLNCPALLEEAKDKTGEKYNKADPASALIDDDQSNLEAGLTDDQVKCKCASKFHVAKCAKWRRDSTALSMSALTSYYYAFEVIDKDGNKTPHYKAYLNWVKSQTPKGAASAKKMYDAGIYTEDEVEKEHTLFTGFK